MDRRALQIYIKMEYAVSVPSMRLATLCGFLYQEDSSKFFKLCEEPFLPLTNQFDERNGTEAATVSLRSDLQRATKVGRRRRDRRWRREIRYKRIRARKTGQTRQTNTTRVHRKLFWRKQARDDGRKSPISRCFCDT